MPFHTVKQGEHLSRIATEYGFADYRTIWEHPENARLKQKRQNPNVLFPGDSLFIPDQQQKTESGNTEQRHRFRLRAQTLILRLAIKDFDHQPLANTACELHVEGHVHQLTTDDSGRIEHPIPQTAENALLVFKDPLVPFDLAMGIKIGHLDPVEELTGQKARLNNLGYNAGPLDGTDEESFRIAVEEFQCDHELTVNGMCDAETQAKLKEIHGC